MGHTPQSYGCKWCVVDKGDKIGFLPYNTYIPTLEKLNNSEISINICLDVQESMHYGVWDGKTLKVFNL